MKKSTQVLTLNLAQAAVAFGVGRETIRLAFKRAYPDHKGTRATILEWHRALSGDERLARVRLNTARAAREEFELALLRKDHIPREDVAKMIIATYGPHREMVVALPGQLCALVNPTDSVHARAHLDRWVTDFLRLKAQVPERAEDVEKWIESQNKKEMK